MNAADYMGEGPRFFKVITESTLRDGELEIPKNFINKYGSKLQKYVSFKVSTGQTWKVKLIHCDDGKIWFKDGLEEFMAYFSLRKGHFLFFKYDKKNGIFDVIIMDDKTGLEIESEDEAETETESEEDETETQMVTETESESELTTQMVTETESESELSIEILDEFSPFREASRGKSPLAFSESKKSKKVENSTTRNGGKGKGPMKAEAMKNFQSAKPFFFVLMQKSHLSKQPQLVIPRAFSRLHFNPKKGEALFSVDAKTWHVHYLTAVCGGYESTRLGRGWKEFATDNHLEVDDACVFELINRSKIQFKVTIFRLGEGSKQKLVGSTSNNRVLK